MDRRRTLLRYSALIVGLALVAGCLLVAYRAFWLTSTASWPRELFSRERWLSAPPEHRYVFWNDLERRRVLVGLPRDEVERLLGTPDSSGPSFLEYIVKYRDRGEYSFSMIYFMQVDLDATGHVSRAFVGAD